MDIVTRTGHLSYFAVTPVQGKLRRFDLAGVSTVAVELKAAPHPGHGVPAC